MPVNVHMKQSCEVLALCDIVTMHLVLDLKMILVLYDQISLTFQKVTCWYRNR